MKNKIKVAMLCDYPTNQIDGGVDMHIDRLTHHLSKMDDIELHIFSFGKKTLEIKKGRLFLHFLKKNIDLIPFVSPISLLKLKKEITKINPDLIHVQGLTIPYITTALFLKNKYPLIATIHGVVSKEVHFEKGFSLIFYLLILKPFEKHIALKIPDTIIVVSQAVKKIISNKDPSKINIIPNGVDLDSITNIKPFKSVNKPCILFVGSLRKIKGVDILLKAVYIVKKSIPNIYVYVVGDGPYKLELEKLSKELSIEENIKFTGYISGDMIYKYYKSTDIFVLPSNFDSGPLVLLEAMACKKPVIASNIGGIPNIVDNNKTGLLFQCGDYNDMAKKIIKILKNPEIQEQLGKAGREKSKGFSWERIANMTIHAYRKTILKKEKN